MTEYYFLATLLPPLQIGNPIDISFTEFEHLLNVNLKPKDLQKTQIIRRYIDIENIRNLWKEQPIDSRGNLDELELEEALLTRGGLPEYIYDFLEKYEDEERLIHFSELIHTFFKKEVSLQKGFLKKYLEFEREWRIVMVGMRAKRLGRDVSFELQHEDATDTLVSQIIAQKDAKSYEPPDGYENLKPLFEENQESPLLLHQALCEYQFSKMEEFCEGDLFSIDRILAYLVQLQIAEKWIELDKTKGLEIVDNIVKGVS